MYTLTKSTWNRRVKIYKKYMEMLEAIEYDLIQNCSEIIQEFPEEFNYVLI